MDFNNKFTFEWKNKGTEPSSQFKNNGFQGGYKPPAGYFNWFWSKAIAAITELQTQLSSLSNQTLTKTGKSLAGKSVVVDAETTATAKGGAEIFNDYRTRTAANPTYGNIATGAASTAHGYSCTASGDYSYTTGLLNTASGANSYATGRESTASGAYSHVEGYKNTASGRYSHAEGTNTTASGDSAYTSGSNNTADGIHAFACGTGNTAHLNQFVAGKYNTPKTGEGVVSQSENATIFMVGNGVSAESTSNALRITADGKCKGSAAFAASGADYSEYFEWTDGNPNAEDRRGKIVTLDGDKIRLANNTDTFILGVISVNGSFVGNTASEDWHKRYKKDVFDERLTQEIEVAETTDEDGNVIPAHTVTQFVVNPEYDPTQEYISREFRKEWSPVGLLGQVVVVDDGTCTVNGYCKVSNNGVGTAGENGYRVLKRIDNTHIKVLVK